MKNEDIIRKITGLLKLSMDSKNDEESQSAFVMAQKLKIKHGIKDNEISLDEKVEISKNQATAYKKLYWWESSLARIISYNFRCKHYYRNDYTESQRVKRAITFYGYESDAELAKEMYILAYDVLKKFTERFVEDFYADRLKGTLLEGLYEFKGLKRDRSLTTKLKNSYMRGFLDGLEQKFEDQRDQLVKDGYELMIVIPHAVMEGYNEMFPSTKKGLSFNRPPVELSLAYAFGKEDGHKVDYAKNTIGDDIEFK